MGPKSYASQTQSSRKSSVTFMICIIISVSIVCILLAPSIFPSSSSTTTSKSNVQSLHSNRLIKYCSIDEFNGEEGKYLDTNNFEMKALVITLRHGDRSAIHSIPGKYTPSIDKIDKDSTSSSYLYDSNVSQYTSSVNQFVIVPMSENGHFDHDKIESVSFMDALDSPSLFGRSDMTLPQGQLTSTGFMQHIHLGDHLHNAYSSFISSVNSVKEVYIRSTNYHRTIQV